MACYGMLCHGMGWQPDPSHSSRVSDMGAGPGWVWTGQAIFGDPHTLRGHLNELRSRQESWVQPRG
jgi:hypothetical protein